MLYACLEAARWRGLSDAAFDALDVQEKARLIAHHRTAMQLAAIEAWEQARETRQKHG